MVDLKDQLRLEDDLVLQGADRFLKNTLDAQESGRGSDTGYGQRLIKNLVLPVAQGVKDFCTDGAKKHGKYKTLLKDMDPEVVAYIALKTVLDQLHSGAPVTRLAMSIGLRIEDQQRFSVFKEGNPAYYATLLKDFHRKNTKAYRHMRNVLAVTSKKKGLEWEGWSDETRLHIGTLLLDRIINNTDIIKISLGRISRGSKKKQYTVVPTTSATEWVEGYNQYASLLHPYTKPCVIPPDDWAGLRNGGYWSEAMRHRTPMIKGLSASEEKFVMDHDLSEVYLAVNSIQRTPWRVNTRVLEVLQHVWGTGMEVGLPSKSPTTIPKFRVETKPKDMDPKLFKEFLEWKGEVAQLYTDENSRASRAYEVSRTVNMAATYGAHESIWFVYQCDFRGRLYASSSGLSPQGPDYCKALLEFGTGKKLGPGGLYWLAVHGANCFGIDKCSFDERIEWIADNLERIIEVKDDPISTVSFWADADHPFMFLAFCFEYADAVYDPEEYVSHLPVGMDGSCNGIQNFSALLRDSVGGAATNLLPSDKPADIYQEVADKALTLLLDAPATPERAAWRAFADKHGGIPRSITKRPVMTLPYGSTRYSCFDFIHEAVREIDPYHFEDLNKASAYLVDFIWGAIQDTVVAARDAMGWLQTIADRMAKLNLPVWWVNPVGFPVYQSNMKTSSKRIRSVLMGDMHLSLNVLSNDISAQKQKQGIAPNFVHSLDSAHMMLTVNKAVSRGITNFAMIHDDFGTHAADVEEFRHIIKESFVEMYKNHEPLHDLYVACALVSKQENLPPVPDYGDLKLSSVMQSEYFFA